MRFGNDYWTDREMENGYAPSTAVWDDDTGVWRVPIVEQPPQVDNPYDPDSVAWDNWDRAYGKDG